MTRCTGSSRPFQLRPSVSNIWLSTPGRLFPRRTPRRSTDSWSRSTATILPTFAANYLINSTSKWPSSVSNDSHESTEPTFTLSIRILISVAQLQRRFLWSYHGYGEQNKFSIIPSSSPFYNFYKVTNTIKYKSTHVFCFFSQCSQKTSENVSLFIIYYHRQAGLAD